jgi:peptidoglycan/LPS O-acetylase OafA/YrhL/lysophospholipase L1-like esterase
MKRFASLDFLRGLAALAVAVPHYVTLNEAGQPVADAIAITAVEVFFVLSGFVLAPQILTMVIAGPIRNLRIFLIRRWMRTIPPYLLALTAVAIVTGQLLTADFVRYVFYIQNLFSQGNFNDFFPVAWSLSVEEWFYVTFAPLLFLLATFSNRRARKLAVAFGVCFILAIIVARSFADHDNWDAAVRRVTVFRVDSIAWGFLLYLATEQIHPFDTSTLMGRALFGASIGAFIACCVIGATVAYHSVDSQISRQLFPFAAAAVGISAVFLFRQSEFLFAGNAARKLGIYLGHISYSVYLFHLVLAMILKPKLADLDLMSQLAIYIALVVGVTSIIWLYIEKPILAARPRYDGRAMSSRQAAARAAPRSLIATAALTLIACILAYYCFRSYEGNHQRTFYLTFMAATAIMFAAARRIQIARVASVFLTLLFVAILLPAADYLFRMPLTKAEAAPTLKPVQPAYTFRSAKANPQAFHAWWAYYVDEWSKLGGGKKTTEEPDPKGLLPFVLVPNSTGKFFDSVIHINNIGFRGADIAIDKQNRFRIFTLGESPTFGPTLRANEKPWPEVLQAHINSKLTCDRPIEVINAGTEAYNLANNIERLRRDVVPLKPDLVISYHGFNGLGVLFGTAPLSNQQQQPTRNTSPSALLAEVGYRFRLAMFRSELRKPASPNYSEDRIMKSKYADGYRQLIQIARDEGFGMVLSTSSMAVSASSPREVKDFYESAFSGIDETIVRNAAHNDMVKKLAMTEHVPLIDTAPQLDGLWDDDLYLDLVHFTQAGNDKMAQTMFGGLSPILKSEPKLRCVD